jgi:microcystin-dependent protein
MKIKVYVAEVRLPRWLRRVLFFGAVPLVTLGLSALVYASAVTGQPDYNDGDVLTAATLNAHLGALQNQINTLSTGDGIVPAGSIIMYGGSTPPNGWLLCDGSAVSRTTYAALLGAIGATYGAGDGLATFNLPDLRQRFPLGMASSGTGSTLGGTGGAIDHTHNFTPAGNVSQPTFIGSAGTTASDGVDHVHSGPSHTHDVDIGAFASGAGSAHSHTYSGVIAHTHSLTAETSIAGAHTHTMPNGGSGQAGTDNGGGTFASSPNSYGNLAAQGSNSSGAHGHTLTGTTDSSGSASATTASESSHTHSIDPPNTTSTSSGTGWTGGASAYLHTHAFTPAGTVSQSVFSGGAGTTSSGNPPFLVVNYIIKY